MFGIDSTEFLVIVIIAVIVIGPKDLPRALYKVGQIVGKAQGMARHFRTGIDAMVREVELEELEKKWAAQNKRIMDDHPPAPATDALPAPDAAPDDGSSVAGWGKRGGCAALCRRSCAARAQARLCRRITPSARSAAVTGGRSSTLCGGRPCQGRRGLARAQG